MKDLLQVERGSNLKAFSRFASRAGCKSSPTVPYRCGSLAQYLFRRRSSGINQAQGPREHSADEDMNIPFLR